MTAFWSWRVEVDLDDLHQLRTLGGKEEVGKLTPNLDFFFFNDKIGEHVSKARGKQLISPKDHQS